MQLSHNWSNDGILLRCFKNALEPPQKFRNVNIPAPTSGMYSTQNMFTLTYFTQLPYYTCTHQGHLSDTHLVLNTGNEPCRQNNIRASAHERVFLPQRWPIISWLCARTVNETLFSHFPHDLVQPVRYTSTRHLLCRMFYDHTPAEILMLPDVYRITD
jgi:hypothetical protein